MKDYVWSLLMIVDGLCMIAGIILLVNSMPQGILGLGGILIALSWVGVLYLGIRKGEGIEEKRED